jgi:hypothetical protein
VTKPSAPPRYVVGSAPALPGGDAVYLDSQLQAIANSLAGINLMTPQSATAAPKTLLDGMMRLSRNPWRPVAGQTTDQLVYWDAAGAVWRLLATAPTNT